MDKKAFLYDFLNQHTLTVISTVTPDNKPEAAVIGFGQTKELEIIFGTNTTTRKYHNIQQNASVAFVIGWDDDQTIQLEGIARELAPSDLQLVKDNYWAKTPSAEKYAEEEGERYFIVKPAWIRYSDISKDPWDIIELTFEN